MDWFSIVLVLASIILLFVLLSKWRYSYWSRRGVPQLEPKLLFGDYKPVYTGLVAGQINLLNIYRKAKAKGLTHIGFYNLLIPEWMPLDVNLIKRTLLKDFDHFRSHGIFTHENEPISLHLFSMEGDEWKNRRTKLSPTFTTGKMKMMFETLIEKTKLLKEIINRKAECDQEIQIKETLATFGTDVIGSIAFGIECNSMEQPDNKFREIGKKVFTPNLVQFLLESTISHRLLAYLGYHTIYKDVAEYFTKIVKETIRYRESTNVQRKDFMELMLQLKNQGDASTRVTEQEVISEAFLFYFAGFETTSTATTFTLLELSQNQEIQDKLRQEIMDTMEKNNGNLSYDVIMQMSYLDKVIQESLRKYPPLAFLPRECTKDYTVPGSNAIIKKGTRVYIPAWGLHMDPEYYPNPEVFNPENFSSENKSKRPDFTYMPFGEGPRMCIGMRFGLMQSKMAIITLLSNFKFSPHKKTPWPLEMDNGSFVLAGKGDMWLRVNKL